MKKTNNHLFYKNFTLKKMFCNPIFIILWWALAILSYFYLDKPIAIFMHGISNAWLLDSFHIITKFGKSTYYFLFFGIVFITAQFIWKNSRIANLALFFFLALAASSIICDTLKIIFSRARPQELFAAQRYGFYFFQHTSKMWSFPSGHAMTIASLMMAAAIIWRRFWIIFSLIMLSVGVSRIIVGAHYLSDVMIGLYLGCIIVIYLERILRNRLLLKFRG